MAQFKQNSNKIVQNLQEKLDKSLYEQREMITDMVRSSVMHEPMPTRAAKEIVKAWKEEMPPWAPERDPTTWRNMSGRRRSWTPRVRTVSRIPVPTSTHMVMWSVIQSETASS